MAEIDDGMVVDAIGDTLQRQSDEVVAMARRQSWGVKVEVNFSASANDAQRGHLLDSVVSEHGGYVLYPSWNEYCDRVVGTTIEGFEALKDSPLVDTAYATGATDQHLTYGQAGGQLALKLG